MGVFLFVGLVGACVAGTGAYWGQLGLDGPPDAQRNAAVEGAVGAVYLGLLVPLLIWSSLIPQVGWKGYGFAALIWGIHGVLVAGLAMLGASVGFKKGEPSRAGWGAGIACAVGCPVSCFPLILLMCLG